MCTPNVAQASGRLTGQDFASSLIKALPLGALDLGCVRLQVHQKLYAASLIILAARHRAEYTDVSHSASRRKKKGSLRALWSRVPATSSLSTLPRNNSSRAPPVAQIPIVLLQCGLCRDDDKLFHADFLIQSSCNRATKAGKQRPFDRWNAILPTPWYDLGPRVWQSGHNGTQE